MSMLKQFGDADVHKETLATPLKEMPTIGNEMNALTDTPLAIKTNDSVEAFHAEQQARVNTKYGK